MEEIGWVMLGGWTLHAVIFGRVAIQNILIALKIAQINF